MLPIVLKDPACLPESFILHHFTLASKTPCFFYPADYNQIMQQKQFHVDAVIFDMDGVITNTMPDHYRCWKQIFREQGIRVTYEDVYKREGQPGLTSVREIFTENGRSFFTKACIDWIPEG